MSGQGREAEVSCLERHTPSPPYNSLPDWFPRTPPLLRSSTPHCALADIIKLAVWIFGKGKDRILCSLVPLPLKAWLRKRFRGLGGPRPSGVSLLPHPVVLRLHTGQEQ